MHTLGATGVHKFMSQQSSFMWGIFLTLAIYDSLRQKWIASLSRIQMMMLFLIRSSFIDARHTSMKLSVICTSPHLLPPPQDLVDAPVCG